MTSFLVLTSLKCLRGSQPPGPPFETGTRVWVSGPNKGGRDFVSCLHLSVYCLGMKWMKNLGNATSLTWQSGGSWRDGSKKTTAATTSVIKVPRPLVVSGPPGSVRHGHGWGCKPALKRGKDDECCGTKHHMRL